MFTDEDLKGVQVPHNNALVVTLRVDYNIEKILMDQGSCTEVLYYKAFKQMGLDPAELVESIMLLIGFSTDVVRPLGRVTLNVWAGSIVLPTNFLLVDVPSSYNAIIGRTWLQRMKAISSTYHQMVKSTEVQYQPTLKDVWGDLTKKAVEGLRKIQIGDDLERYFLINETLAEQEEQGMVWFLKQHINVFAWTPKEMPGVDPGVVCHHLNVDPLHKPVLQKKRRLAIQHAKAMIEEIDKLLEADAIKEVHYPEWLLNAVVVKKKNGKWRVCVYFNNLNKDCPKDSFPLRRIDQLVNATPRFKRMSFLDAYRL
ncbi:uncharacterized protein LOC131306838 [Rhododendron vialii]|uniref:uncharacterized protein LOC131306838 n=1 Tax=Rhododendron vialii TaxID=182163 RepID=UPI00265E2721|nr:uncharacterized protein LOC131306838 [Rhododendron vialii]